MPRTPLRETIAAQEEQINTLLKANEEIYSSYTLLERRVEDLSYIDLNNIFAAVGTADEVLPQRERVRTLLRIRRLRHENPMAKQAIKLARRFVLGKGIRYDSKDSNIQRIIEAFWDDPVNQIVWTSYQAMVRKFDELLTDGEQFPVLASSPEAPYVRIGMMPMEEMTQIIYDPDNGDVPVWYRRQFKRKEWDPTLNNGEGGWAVDPYNLLVVRYYRDWRISDEYLRDIESRGLVIPTALIGEGVVKHRMVNEVKMRSGLRGLSELFASREWFRVFKEFMEDRGAINAQANALAVQRKITGGPTDVARISGKVGGVPVGMHPDQPLTPSSFRRPMAASIMDTNQNVEYKNIRADTGAVNAHFDAELFRATAGAGTATPDHYFGASNMRMAAAQAIELAVVKAFEEYQTYLRNDNVEMCAYVLQVAMNLSAADALNEARAIAWSFPPIMTQDIVKWVTAFAQWTQQVAPKNREIRLKAIRMVGDVLNVPDLDMIWPEVEAEETRIATFEDKQQKLAQQTQQATLATAQNPAAPPPNGNGNGKTPPSNSQQDGQKTTTGPTEQGKSPDITRLSRGRPPSER